MWLSVKKVQNSAAKLFFKACKFDNVQPLLQALHWLPVQARIDYKLSAVTTSWTISCLFLWPSHCVHPFQAVSFFYRHINGYFVFPMLEQKLLAKSVPSTVLQSYGIHSLLMSVIFSPPMPLKLQYELTCTMCRCGVWGIQHYDCMIIIFEVLMDTFLLIFVCSPLSVRYSTMKITIVVIIIP